MISFGIGGRGRKVFSRDERSTNAPGDGIERAGNENPDKAAQVAAVECLAGQIIADHLAQEATEQHAKDAPQCHAHVCLP